MKTQPSQPQLNQNSMGSAGGQRLKGQYIGVLRSHKGKLKGLHLRQGDQIHHIKLPKYLRPVLVRELQPGALIQVWVSPYKEDLWKADNLAPLTPAEIAELSWDATVDLPLPTQAEQPRVGRLTIQVCRKGTCHKRGSDLIWQELQAEISTNPQFQGVTLEKTGCLKACKKGPNVQMLPSGKVLKGVSPEAVRTEMQKLLKP